MSNTLTEPQKSPKPSETIREYWDRELHDQQMSRELVGSPAWFADLAAYRYEKLDYLPRVVDFGAYAGKRVLEVGCGVGLDLALFARGGAEVTGIDLSPRAVSLARDYLRQQRLEGRVLEMDAGEMTFPDAQFDLVYAHGVLPYAENPQRAVSEMYRVLKPGGTAVAMAYHRDSWLPAVSRVTKVRLEHEGAPVFRTMTRSQVYALFNLFKTVCIIPERFPVPTKLHKGWKGFLYNSVFVPAFHALPRTWTQQWGWHLMIWAER